MLIWIISRGLMLSQLVDQNLLVSSGLNSEKWSLLSADFFLALFADLECYDGLLGRCFVPCLLLEFRYDIRLHKLVDW